MIDNLFLCSSSVIFKSESSITGIEVEGLDEMCDAMNE